MPFSEVSDVFFSLKSNLRKLVFLSFLDYNLNLTASFSLSRVIFCPSKLSRRFVVSGEMMDSEKKNTYTDTGTTQYLNFSGTELMPT